MSTRGPLSHRGVHAPWSAAKKGFGDCQGKLKNTIRKESINEAHYKSRSDRGSHGEVPKGSTNSGRECDDEPRGFYDISNELGTGPRLLQLERANHERN
jgi:hypothetical protein